MNAKVVMYNDKEEAFKGCLDIGTRILLMNKDTLRAFYLDAVPYKGPKAVSLLGIGSRPVIDNFV